MFSFRLSSLATLLIVSLSFQSLGVYADDPITHIPSAFPISRDAYFQEVIVARESPMLLQSGPQPVSVNERTIYSNTLGRVAVVMPANQIIADDISTTAPDGCNLTRFTFQTTGRADSNQAGGPYSINYALYQFCPGSVSPSNRPLLIIPGTSGTVDFPDDGFHTVTVVLPPNIFVPTNFYLGLVANRANVGVVMGAPPSIGFSCDVFDLPPLQACSANLSSDAKLSYSSFNTEFFADSSCPQIFVGYRNDNPRQSALVGFPNQPVYDDLHLNTDNCQMSAYEVMTKGSGFYQFDLATSCGGPVIPNTHGEAAINATPGIPNKLRFAFDPLVTIPRDFWFGVTINNATSGIIMTGRDACTGHTDDVLCEINPFGDPIAINVPNGVRDAFDVTIICTGTPPIGACCDFYSPDVNGNSVCRQLPQMNCPFSDQNGLPQWAWQEGQSCDPSPFPVACGLSACCGMYEHSDPSNPGHTIVVEDCENLTENDCSSQHPPTPQFPGGAPSLWQPGFICDQGMPCPRIACMERSGKCNTTHSTFGCSDVWCCDCVCRSFGELGSYCCEVEWDDTCLQLIKISPCGDPLGSCASALSDCDDGVACTIDTFDPDFRSCQHTPNNSACNDGNGCTTDSCDPTSGCVHSANSDPCDDGNACTTVDTCSGGICTGSVPRVCIAIKQCTDAGCDPATGCVYTDSTGPCDDGDPCTTNDTCELGRCMAGAPTNCDDGDRCTSDSCEPSVGCVHENICGSCCNQRDGACTDSALAGSCNCRQCVWTAGGSCSTNLCQPQFVSIPTVSTWGAAIIGLVLLVGLKIQFGRRQTKQTFLD